MKFQLSDLASRYPAPARVWGSLAAGDEGGEKDDDPAGRHFGMGRLKPLTAKPTLNPFRPCFHLLTRKTRCQQSDQSDEIDIFY